MTADLLTRLIEAGTPAALVAEVAMLAARAEQVSVLPVVDPVAERRREWDRQYRRDKRSADKMSGGSGGCRVDIADNADTSSFLDKKPPHTPQKINPISGVCVAHEADPISVPVEWKLLAAIIVAAIAASDLRNGRERVAIDGAVAAWNAMAGRTSLPNVTRMTEERRSRLRTRLAEYGPDALTEAIAAVERSPFCRGDNERGWRADFDFLLQPKSFNRLIEGSYDRAPSGTSDRPRSQRADRSDQPRTRNPYKLAQAARRDRAGGDGRRADHGPASVLASDASHSSGGY